MMETIQDVLQLILQADDIKYVKIAVYELWTGFETGGGT